MKDESLIEEMRAALRGDRERARARASMPRPAQPAAGERPRALARLARWRPRPRQ